MPDHTAGRPGVSLILLLRNERSSLPSVLPSLLAAAPSDGRPWEILIVDGASEDGSAEVAAEWCAIDPDHRRLLANPRRTTPWAMTIGLPAAQHPYLAFCGAHTQYPEGYFSRLAGVLDRGEHVAVGGRCRVVPSRHGTSWAPAVAVASDHWFGVGLAPHRHRAHSGVVQTVMMPLYRKAAVEAVGGVPTDLVRGQDFELNRRLREAGGTLWLEADQICEHAARPSLRAFLHYRARTGFWPLYGMRYGGRAFSRRHLAPAVALLGWVGMLLLGLSAPAVGWAAVAGLVGYLTIAAGVGLASARSMGSPLVAFQLPFVFGCGHLAYALGTLAAAVRLVMTIPVARLGRAAA